MERARVFRRRMRKNHIARKKNICKAIYEGWTPKHDGYLAKGKVHCSCWMCAFHGPTIQDRKRIEAMDLSEKESA